MNWQAVSAVADTAATVAVFITLVYLSLQMRFANKQRELESIRHSWDALNQFCDLVADSAERASIINRGRADLASLDRDERVVFDHIHLRMLNTLEAWHIQVTETSKPGAYRDQQLENIAGVAKLYFDHPGTRAFWAGVDHLFAPIRAMVDAQLAGPAAPDTGAAD